jgi:ABC-2 type transport system permease protein
MLWRIIKHEWRHLTADWSLGLAVALFALLIGYGVWNGASWLSFHRETMRLVKEDEAQRFERVKAQLIEIEKGYKATDPYADASRPFAVGGFLAYRYAAMPPAPLSALSVGQSDLYPSYTGVTIWSNKRQHWSNRRSFVRHSEIENPTNLLAGRFDVAFVIVYLYPLLILALSYNLISVEKEQGTLQMLLAQPVSLKTFVLGKVGSRAAVILLSAISLSLVGALLSGTDLASASAVLRFALWAAVLIAYGLFWFGLAVAINAFGKSSATNATALAALWLLLVVIIPALSNLIVTTVYPTPPRTAMIEQMRQAWIEADAKGGKLAEQFYQDHPELMPAGTDPDVRRYAATTFYAAQAEIDQRIEPVLERYDAQLAKQQKLIDRFRYLSPAIVAQEALNDIAGTGAARFRHFRAQVENFHGVWRSFFVPKLFRKENFTLADYAAIPSFTLKEEPVSVLIRRVSTGLAGIAVPTLVVAGLGLLALRRYPVTG